MIGQGNVSLPVELKDQVMLRLKLLEALMDMSRFLLACAERKRQKKEREDRQSRPCSPAALQPDPNAPRFASRSRGVTETKANYV
ncbi:hypothetical protein EYF80_050495 [Liparis tanakae]|uniref:Uncharacterized protein n=1 Tax=Liparis tanakae TaxID=230148 RepID=A0A4Z2FEM4_9TELE|nr:hypothetical protein EYF80_050495 [Liparis tanakae]